MLLAPYKQTAERITRQTEMPVAEDACENMLPRQAHGMSTKDWIKQSSCMEASTVCGQHGRIT